MIILRKLFSNRYVKVLNKVTKLQKAGKHSEAAGLLDNFAILTREGSANAVRKTAQSTNNDPVAVYDIIKKVNRHTSIVNSNLKKLSKPGKRSYKLQSSKNYLDLQVGDDITGSRLFNQTKKVGIKGKRVYDSQKDKETSDKLIKDSKDFIKNALKDK